MANVKDLLASPATASVQQPPSGVSVTEAQDKSPSANIISQAESKKQIDLRASTETASEQEAPPKKEVVIKKVGVGGAGATNVVYSIEQGRHKLVVTPEKGLTYNYLAVCSCQWQGRFLTVDLAETAAKVHVSRT